MSKNLFAKQKSAYICIICGLVAVLLVACGGERTTPTPLPADIVRPVQPTPVYQTSANFILATATPPTTTVASRVPLSPTELMTATASVTGMQTASTTLSPPAFIPQTPTALGIATGGAVLQATPGGRALVNLPAGATVTVTGKSADGRYLTAYTDQAIVGWIAAGQLLLLGGEELVVVESASGPGPIATLMAEAMQPVTITQVISSGP